LITAGVLFGSVMPVPEFVAVRFCRAATPEALRRLNAVMKLFRSA
jgi:hypothetical protein